MKKFAYNLTCHVLGVFILTIIFLTANAQKQPRIQEVSVRAPNDIKIDGLLKEWPNSFLNAHNVVNRCYYVVSNDDNNLYFTIRGQGQGVAFKVLNGGLSITINRALGKKERLKTKGDITITYPVPLPPAITAGIMGPVSITTQDPEIMASPSSIDSMVAIANERLAKAMKEIWIFGAKDFPDSVISVYNTYGIKAATRFMVSGVNRQPVYELAIPLKYLGLSTDNPTKFSYNIKLNQPNGAIVSADSRNGVTVKQLGGPNAPLPQPIDASNASLENPNVMFREGATDFWGEYILATK